MATFPPTLVQFVSLLKNHRKQPEEIRSIQERKLRKLIRHAYDKVPYYRELFNSNKIEPQDIQTLKDLETIPLTSKKQLQDLALEDKLSEGIDPLRCKSFSTSGTTGIPLVSYFTPHDSTLKNLSWIRTFKLNDLKPWHKMADPGTNILVYGGGGKSQVGKARRIGSQRSCNGNPMSSLGM